MYLCLELCFLVFVSGFFGVGFGFLDLGGLDCLPGCCFVVSCVASLLVVAFHIRFWVGFSVCYVGFGYL